MSDIDYSEVLDYANEGADFGTPEKDAAAAAHAKAMGEYGDAETGR